MSEIIGLRTRLKPGMEAAYEKAHFEVWPDLVSVQRELGIEHWRIFRHGVELFHVVECTDFERAVAALEVHPIDQRWQKEMAQYVEVAHDGKGAAVERLRLVYNR